MACISVRHANLASVVSITPRRNCAEKQPLQCTCMHTKLEVLLAMFMQGPQSKGTLVS